MPDLITDPAAAEIDGLNELDDPAFTYGNDPGMDGADEVPAPVAKGRKKREPAPKVDTLGAVNAVLALMGRPNAGTKPDQAGAGTHPRPSLPSARARNAIEYLAQLGTVEALDAAQIDVKALCQDLFDWDPNAGPTRATKTVTKTVAAALLARDANGVSRYSQAVEMLSFAAAAAPLLQPDRLARLIETAPSVRTAFAPERYTMQLASVLRTIMVRYPEQRREQLLTSLWAEAHNGRWWDMTSGLPAARPERNGHAAQVLDDNRRLAAEGAARDVLDGAREGTGAAHAKVIRALKDGALPFNVATSRLVAALPVTDGLRTLFAEHAATMRAGKHVDPDVALHGSHLEWLRPTERPETPLTWLLRSLVNALIPDPDTGVVALDTLPDKPKTFSALYPQAELRGFPFPPEIRRLTGTLLDGTVAGDVTIEVINSPVALAENRDYMGNCTWSYKPSMETGSYVLLQLWRGGDCYNAALRHTATSWQLGEINSRFNRGNVPDDIRHAVTRLTQTLPAPGPLPEVRRPA